PVRTPGGREGTRLASDGAVDDSGIFLAVAFEAPVTDPASLAQVGAARQGRAARGIARFEAELAKLGAPKSDRDAARAARYQLYLGGLHLFDARFEEVMRHFEASRAIHPDPTGLYAANIEALLGIAALRRGETENCIACCTDASCIFPLAPAAVHRQTAGSRQA